MSCKPCKGLHHEKCGLQVATALLAAAMPQGRAVQDVLDPADAPAVAASDWQWLAVACLVMGQVCAIHPDDKPAPLCHCRDLRMCCVCSSYSH